MNIVSRTRNRIKKVFERIGNEQLKNNVLSAIPFWIASLSTALLAVLYTKLFVFAEEGTHFIVSNHKWLLFIITPLCFIIAWWVVVKYAPFSRGSGIPQVMASVELANPRDDWKVNKFLSLRIIVVKILSSLIMILGGGA